ncbi:hypothetical protein [Enterobacter hormaechei]|uniref:hypothetical protein n=1 Tax=Enterobacter hormaechei TaxID=158836 RepID=UPI000793CCE4|nr:hypothetical protein [Enterobacter hormaechei]HDS3652532.1 hypothetical protein [Enterobacter hormaechei subsp. steigerwaltii]MBG0686134.1 hypothetical protein [Enterobacter hormaechei]MBW7665068.1 hypothetical protein [Enterobacter hormaechei]MDH1745486.1 hypothetical protein [Enterobacter hormaechei]MDU6846797.1 hypothetical protein [Enterobacter hormaechei]
MNPWGAITAAIIAGAIAFVGMVVTKESKISDFRQEWINDLRTKIAELISIFDVISKESDFSADEKNEAKKNVNRVIAEVRLRLNHSNPTAAERELGEVITDINLEIMTRGGEVSKHYERLTKLTHLVLKEEWTRVKKGENSYMMIKNFLSVIAVILAAMTITWFAIFIVTHSGLFKTPLF